MSEIKTELLFQITLDVLRISDLGNTPFGHRRIIEIEGGSFEGPKMRGRAMPGGGDWLLIRPDGGVQMDVRLILETDDEHLIYMNYRGIRHGPEEVIARLNAGDEVDPSEYYFRIAPFFETSSETYGWLNRIICVGTGHRKPSGPVYSVFEVL
jgi:hypothetical protein